MGRLLLAEYHAEVGGRRIAGCGVKGQHKDTAEKFGDLRRNLGIEPAASLGTSDEWLGRKALHRPGVVRRGDRATQRGSAGDYITGPALKAGLSRPDAWPWLRSGEFDTASIGAVLLAIVMPDSPV